MFHVFICAALSDSVAKESCMLNLLLSLPEPNLVTFLFLLDHLKRYPPLSHFNPLQTLHPVKLYALTHTHGHTPYTKYS